MTTQLKEWALATLERALKTAAQTALAAITTTAVLAEINWDVVGGTVAVATLASVLTSITTITLTSDNRPAVFGPEKIQD